TESGSLEVLLVHRPRYNDWSFPKGKLEPGETLEQAAIREVEEETGLTCSLVKELTISRYQYRTRKGELQPKAVHYFLMNAATGRLREHQDEEIDRVEWAGALEALAKLSYTMDRELLASIFPAEPPHLED